MELCRSLYPVNYSCTGGTETLLTAVTWLSLWFASSSSASSQASSAHAAEQLPVGRTGIWINTGDLLKEPTDHLRTKQSPPALRFTSHQEPLCVSERSSKSLTVVCPPANRNQSCHCDYSYRQPWRCPRRDVAAACSSVTSPHLQPPLLLGILLVHDSLLLRPLLLLPAGLGSLLSLHVGQLQEVLFHPSPVLVSLLFTLCTEKSKQFVLISPQAGCRISTSPTETWGCSGSVRTQWFWFRFHVMCKDRKADSTYLSVQPELLCFVNGVDNHAHQRQQRLHVLWGSVAWTRHWNKEFLVHSHRLAVLVCLLWCSSLMAHTVHEIKMLLSCSLGSFIWSYGLEFWRDLQIYYFLEFSHQAAFISNQGKPTEPVQVQTARLVV